jgi:hypothetical protein
MYQILADENNAQHFNTNMTKKVKDEVFIA